MGDLNKMFNPGTVALIGADDGEGSAGRSILNNLLASGGRKIFPVNRDKDKVLDLDCLPSISDVGEHIDLAVITVPGEEILSVTEECGKRGVEGANIMSAAPRSGRQERE